MAMKKYKPTSPGRRGMTSLVRVEGSKNRPHKPLVSKLTKSGGRGNEGKIAAQLGAGVEGVRGLAVDEAARVIAAGLGRGPLGSDFAVARFR